MSNREQTRDRLLYEDSSCHCAPTPPPFPSHVMPLSVFEDMMYKVAYVAGYAGTKTDFRQDLAEALNGAQQLVGLVIQKDSINDFPSIGVENAIYIDTSKRDIYYWQDDGYYKVESGSGTGGESIPPDGLIYEGGVI